MQVNNIDEKQLGAMNNQVNPTEAVFALISGLKPRTKDIIIKRFGLDGNNKQTLEEIGKFHGITRERVRQIESAAIKDLKNNDKIDLLEGSVNLLEKILMVYGNISECENLINKFNASIADNKTNGNIIEFILILSDQFEQFDETDNMRKAWGLKNYKLDVPQKAVKILMEVLEARKKPLMEIDAIKSVLNHSESLEAGIENQKAVLSYLKLSKKVLSNPYQEWGLSSWSEITPKGVKDKAYLVLKKNGRPLHFTDITKKINEANFNGKRAISQTVHNELIKDKRFVLVGRGMYALVEWGYNPGTVAEVIESALINANVPLSKEELIDVVLKQRMVKRNTVVLALQNRDRFIKTSDKKYFIHKK
jgi:DNA-directed RNA polymerase delta subunit